MSDEIGTYAFNRRLETLEGDVEILQADLAVNVRNYGAVGDGVTDDTAAIQAAVNALSAGGLLAFPAGTYVVSAPITVPNTSPLTVVGDGPAATRIKPITDGRIFVFAATGTGFPLVISGIRFGHISGESEDFAFDHPMLELQYTMGWAIEDCWFGINGTGTAIYLNAAFDGLCQSLYFRAGSSYVPIEIDDIAAQPQMDTITFFNVVCETFAGILIRGITNGISTLLFNEFKIVGPSAVAFAESTLASGSSVNDTTITAASGEGASFAAGNLILLGHDGNQEFAKIDSINGDVITLTKPLRFAHASGQQVLRGGVGISLSANTQQAAIYNSHFERLGVAIQLAGGNGHRTVNNRSTVERFVRLVGPVQDSQFLNAHLSGRNNQNYAFDIPTLQSGTMSRLSLLGPFIKGGSLNVEVIEAGVVRAITAAPGTKLASVVHDQVVSVAGFPRIDRNVSSGSGTAIVERSSVAGTEKFSRDANGKIVWTEASLERLTTSILKVTGKLVATTGLGVGNAAAATTPGSVVKKIEVFDAAGASLGYIPVYSAIT